MEESDVDKLKREVITKCDIHKARIDRSRRLFIEDRAWALKNKRAVEYQIKSEVSSMFGVRYSSVSFAGSAQLGFSPAKNTLFSSTSSDLDVACIDSDLFQRAWIDVIDVTRAFTDSTKFSGLSADKVGLFKDSILRRGMIMVKCLPSSMLSSRWKSFEDSLSRKYSSHFRGVSIAIYLNEYAFCWKQDSAVSLILRG